MALNFKLFSVLTKKTTKQEALLDNDLQNMYDAIGEIGDSEKYMLGQFSNTIIPKTDYDKNILGDVTDFFSGVFPGYMGTYPFDRLNDGTIVIVPYCQSVLADGTMIFEAYPLNESIGYWLAYRQDSSNPNRLIKVGECEMTEQFWNNWYDFTAKDSGKNSVKLVSFNGAYNDATTLESWITKLTWTGTELVAEDIYFDFGGATVLSLYSDLTGIEPTDTNTWDYNKPSSILDDDYYGMAMGAEAGWTWYRNYNVVSSSDLWVFVGYNVLTGETKWVDTVSLLPEITNFTPDWSYDEVIQQWINHPNGLTLLLWDGLSANNGDNYNGVTALWSPYWKDTTTCIYLELRTQNTISGTISQYACTEGNVYIDTWGWDNVAIYLFSYIAGNIIGTGDKYNMICHKYDTNTKEITSYYISNPIGNAAIWYNNNGVLLVDNSGKISTYMSISSYLKSDDDIEYVLNLDVPYPTNMIGDKVFNYTSSATYNINSLGMMISSYRKITF